MGRRSWFSKIHSLNFGKGDRPPRTFARISYEKKLNRYLLRK
jgi:hypothetical protein